MNIRATSPPIGERLRLFAQPTVAIVIAAAVLAWALRRPLTTTERVNLTAGALAIAVWQHVLITLTVLTIVVVVGVPLGTLLTRRRFHRTASLFLGLANVGAAAPAVGLIVLFYLITHRTGFWIGVAPIAFYSLLPVLRNTILGYRSVDPDLVDAGRGLGMPAVTVLRRIEFPVAVPFILAGLRTSLVLAVGTATLSFLVSAGGLGILIDTGYKLRDNVTLIVGAVLAVALALFVDWLGALAERFLGPQGLR